MLCSRIIEKHLEIQDFIVLSKNQYTKYILILIVYNLKQKQCNKKLCNNDDPKFLFDILENSSILFSLAWRQKEHPSWSLSYSLSLWPGKHEKSQCTDIEHCTLHSPQRPLPLRFCWTTWLWLRLHIFMCNIVCPMPDGSHLLHTTASHDYLTQW
jgi:hypothetical protein